MLKILLQCGLMLLPFVIYDLAMVSAFAYLGLNAADQAKNFERSVELARLAVSSLNSLGSSLCHAVGMSTNASKTGGEVFGLIAVLSSSVPIALAIVLWWRFEIRTYKKVVMLWRQRKAVT